LFSLIVEDFYEMCLLELLYMAYVLFHQQICFCLFVEHVHFGMERNDEHMVLYFYFFIRYVTCILDALYAFYVFYGDLIVIKIGKFAY
jgi:hypothetical protein